MSLCQLLNSLGVNTHSATWYVIEKRKHSKWCYSRAKILKKYRNSENVRFRFKENVWMIALNLLCVNFINFLLLHFCTIEKYVGSMVFCIHGYIFVSIRNNLNLSFVFSVFKQGKNSPSLKRRSGLDGSSENIYADIDEMLAQARKASMPLPPTPDTYSSIPRNTPAIAVQGEICLITYNMLAGVNVA